MKFFISIFALFILFSTPVNAEEINAGFVEGLWYADDSVFTNQPTRIYVALRNNTDSELTGKVSFKDGDTVISTQNISALSGRLIEAWADWTPTYGEHTITATLTNLRLHTVGEDPRIASTPSSISDSFIFVDYDTDADGIGNEEDTDDDNDGISDEDEITNGTDPLVANATEPEEEEVTEETTTEEVVTENKDGDDTKNVQVGLEKYFEPGTVDTLLSNVTNKVAVSKKTLDEYRAERNISDVVEETNSSDSNTVIYSSISSSTDEIPATVTRSKIEPESIGFIGTLIAGVKGILGGLYTFVLWIISKVFGHPALVQLLLLIGILYIVFKLARKIGGRPQ